MWCECIVVTFPSVYVEREYGKAVALDDIPLGPHMPLEFTSCGSDENAIGSYADPCWGFVDVAPGLVDADAPLSAEPWCRFYSGHSAELSH